MNKVYKIHMQNRGDLEVIMHGFRIGLLDKKFMTYLEYRNGIFVMKECGKHVFDRKIFRIATKYEIMQAGIWNFVVNKDDFYREENKKEKQQKSVFSSLKFVTNCVA